MGNIGQNSEHRWCCILMLPWKILEWKASHHVVFPDFLGMRKVSKNSWYWNQSGQNDTPVYTYIIASREKQDRKKRLAGPLHCITTENRQFCRIQCAYLPRIFRNYIQHKPSSSFLNRMCFGYIWLRLKKIDMRATLSPNTILLKKKNCFHLIIIFKLFLICNSIFKFVHLFVFHLYIHLSSHPIYPSVHVCMHKYNHISFCIDSTEKFLKQYLPNGKNIFTQWHIWVIFCFILCHFYNFRIYLLP